MLSENEIRVLFREIENAVFVALIYDFMDKEKIDNAMSAIDLLLKDENSLGICEKYFSSSGEENVLYFISNILYNLKTKTQLVITPEVLKWLGSVWKNFINRNKVYQEQFGFFKDQKARFEKYFGTAGLVHKIENVHMVTQDFLVESNEEDTPLRKLERFYKTFSEIMGWMKPTYYFMLDYYYEWQSRSIESVDERIQKRLSSLKNFGYEGYTYGAIANAVCQSLAILEAVYLILKKKKTSRQIFSIDGKTRLLSISEIYDIYRDKLLEAQNELSRLK
ncbi:MAG: hypothetical protein N2316_11105 [Spirochaetes bacterium]|nr:hypothetical protein [Spirochaetota bacterium]